MGKFDKTEKAFKKQVSRDGRPKRGRSPAKSPDRTAGQPSGNGSSHLPPLKTEEDELPTAQSFGSDSSPGFEVIEPPKPGFEYTRIQKKANAFGLEEVDGDIQNVVERIGQQRDTPPKRGRQGSPVPKRAPLAKVGPQGQSLDVGGLMGGSRTSLDEQLLPKSENQRIDDIFRSNRSGRRPSQLDRRTRMRMMEDSGVFDIDCHEVSDETRRDPERPSYQPSPIDRGASFLDKWFYRYCTPYCALAKDEKLTEPMLPDLHPRDQPRWVFQKAKFYWDQELKRENESRGSYKASLVTAFRKTFMRSIVLAVVFKVLNDMINMCPSILLKFLIGYLNDCGSAFTHGDQKRIDSGEVCSLQEGMFLSFLMFLQAVALAIVQNSYFDTVTRMGMNMKSATCSLVYDKALKMDTLSAQAVHEESEADPSPIMGKGAKGSGKGGLSRTMTRDDVSKASSQSTGKILNLMSVDAQRLQDVMQFGNIIWSGPFQILLAMTYLFVLLKFSTLGVLLVMGVQFPFILWNGKRQKAMQRVLLGIKDERMKRTNEAFGSARLLKMYAWEFPFIERIVGIRSRELDKLKSYLTANFQMRAFFGSTKTIVGVVTLSTYQLIYGDLTTETALSAMTVFSMLQFPLQMFPNSIASILEAQLAVGRVENFLNSPEIEERPMIPRTHPSQPSIVVEDVTLSWPNGNLLLQDVGFVVPAKGKLTVIMGSVGAGKSGLLTALIGELPARAGDITLLGSLAYASQVPWIRHATVRENIIFDRDFNECLYTIVLNACSLMPDLKTMPAEDHSEIGEKGINLSGGQKARIALARALYAKADVLLLDDPLSAVDAHVMHQLLRTFKSSLVSNSAVVLATHQEAALAYADQVVMLEDQRMTFTGTPEEYCEKFGVRMPERPEASPTSTAVFSPNSQPFTGASPSSEKDGGDKNECEDRLSKIYKKQPSLMRMVKSDADKANSKGGLVNEEAKKSGNISWAVYEDYMKSCGGDWRIYALIGGKFLTAILVTSADVWVSFWTSHISNGPDHISTAVGVGVYGVVGIGQLVYQFWLGVMIFSAALKGSVRYHNDCLQNLMRVPVSFFDTTPLGRVLNIFSKDIYTIDEQLVSTFNMLKKNFLKKIFGYEARCEF